MQTGGGPSRLRGEGRQCCSSRRRPGARAAGSASLPGPTQKLVATNRRPRVPLAASGGVGGRARGRGRLADAAANWWADPESPRKRGRLSAVRQARLCGSGSPLLQRSPWQSPECLGAAQPSAARRQLQPAAPRLRPPSQRLRCPQLHKTSAAARPTAPGRVSRRWQSPATAAMSCSSSTTKESGAFSVTAVSLSTTSTSKHTKPSWLPVAPTLGCFS